MKKEFLPIGSVVMLEGGTKPLMITGYRMKASVDDEQVYDYVACVFPEGFMEQVYSLFNNEQIHKVMFVGYEDEEFKNHEVSIKEGVIYGPATVVREDGKLPLNTRRGRKPKAPTKPKSKSEMMSEYGVAQKSEIGGEEVLGDDV